MASILRMPAVLAGATEAVLARWCVEEGSAFSTGDTLAEIETDKALVDLPAEQDGILGRALISPGETTAVGAPIAVIVAGGETAADMDAAVGAGDRATAVRQATPARSERVFSSPIARRLAREHHLDVAEITGTGPGGRIVRRDVEGAVERRENAEPVSSPSAPQTGFTEIPHSGMRRAIARRLTESATTVPHFTVTAECLVDELLQLRQRVNAAQSKRISLTDFVVKAVAAAFAAVPDANVTWTDTHLKRYEHVDVSVAVATDGGLVTPVVRGVDGLSLSALSASIRQLAERARAGRLRQDELEGGSFTVTNLGMYGTRAFTAILNPPQSGILAVGAAEERPIVRGGQLGTGQVMTCTLSVDHRAVDGALAARWLAAFEAAIEHPLSILV